MTYNYFTGTYKSKQSEALLRALSALKQILLTKSDIFYKLQGFFIYYNHIAFTFQHTSSVTYIALLTPSHTTLFHIINYCMLCLSLCIIKHYID